MTRIPNPTAWRATRRPMEPRAHDAQGFPVELGADQRGTRPLSAAHSAVRLHDLPDQSKQQGEGVFSDGCRILAPGRGNDDTALGRSFEIDRVNADAVASDNGEGGRTLDDRPCYRSKARQNAVRPDARCYEMFLGRITAQNTQLARR